VQRARLALGWVVSLELVGLRQALGLELVPGRPELELVVLEWALGLA
jgi:hypothetical protein